jgi:phosphomannomutase
VGARVVGIDASFSPDFFGRSPEPRPGDLATLGRRVRQHRALLGATFDGDGDRVLFVDGTGSYVEPELVALLLHRRWGRSAGSLVASVDASRRLERLARVRRSRVGTRFVIEAMRRTRAEVGVEASSHIYLGREYESSDGVRVMVELARLLGEQPRAIDGLREEMGPIVRAQGTLTFGTFSEAETAYDRLRASAPGRASGSIDGFLVRMELGECLVRRSNTQPSVRFALESEREGDLARLARATTRWVRDVAQELRASAALRFA